MAAAYDISASNSVDTSSRAATGPIQFGDVYLASTGGSIGLSWGWVLVLGLAVWWFFIRKKS